MGLKGGDGGGEEGGEEGEISPMCESIGHLPLQGRCPKKAYQAMPVNAIKAKCLR